MSKRRALVTGGAGFIGSHLSDALLEQQYDVTVLDNLHTGSFEQVPEQARFVEGDVRNQDDVDRAFAQGPDVVFHLAGQASIRLAFADPGADLAVNVKGTLNVLQACQAAAVPRLLYASSMTVYGNPSEVPTRESTPVQPVAPYGVTKYAAERYVQLAAEHADPPLSVTSFRMFNVYGPRQALDNPYQGVLAIFIGNLLRGEPIRIDSDGEQSRDFVHVSDVCRAWLKAVDEPRAAGRVLNLGSGKPTTMNVLCDTVLRSFGTSREEHDVEHREAQPGDIRMSAAHIEAAADVLGWSPEIDLATGLAETVAWARRLSPIGDESEKAADSLLPRREIVDTPHRISRLSNNGRGEK